MHNDDKYAVWLNSIEGIGSRRYFELVRHFGSAKSVFENADYKELNKILGLGEKLSSLIMGAKDITKLEENISIYQRKGIDIFILGQTDYPAMLAEIPDPPPVLFFKGIKPLKLDKPIAMVGTRQNSRYGRKVALGIAKQLAQSGVTVISGMARGIDTFSHMGALEGGGYTIAVTGCGPDIIYPPENKELYQKILSTRRNCKQFPPGD